MEAPGRSLGSKLAIAVAVLVTVAFLGFVTCRSEPAADASDAGGRLEQGFAPDR